MMSTLTTRQRDLLHILLDAQSPMGTAELADQMQLTPRQVNYRLNGLKQWLADVGFPSLPTFGTR